MLPLLEILYASFHIFVTPRWLRAIATDIASCYAATAADNTFNINIPSHYSSSLSSSITAWHCHSHTFHTWCSKQYSFPSFIATHTHDTQYTEFEQAYDSHYH